MPFAKGVVTGTHDRSAPRKGKFKLLRDLSMKAMNDLGYDKKGLDGVAGFVRKLAEDQPELVFKLMMKPPRPSIKIDARSSATDEWRLGMLAKMESQGFKLIEGQIINAEETDES